MSVMLPHRRSHTFLLGLLLIDLPVFVAVAALGTIYGFKNTYWTISDWRMAHPWSLIPSLLLAIWLIRKWWKT
jgi:hypothetical protein